jgi:hypothetical protein
MKNKIKKNFLKIFSFSLRYLKGKTDCRFYRTCTVKNSKNFMIGIIICILIVIILIALFVIFTCYYKKKIREKKKKQLLQMYKKYFLFQDLMKPLIYNEEKIKELKEKEACAICLQDFVINKSKICKTPCQHIFHFYCIKKYILSSEHCECPLCKFELLTDLDEDKLDVEHLDLSPINEEDNPANEIPNKIIIKENILSTENLNDNNEDGHDQNGKIENENNNRIQFIEY